MPLRDRIFNIKTEQDFNDLAVEIFHYQYQNNRVYHDFVDALPVDAGALDHFEGIPCLPVSFFKTRDVVSGNDVTDIVFISSGTTGMTRSRHCVRDIAVYEQSLLRGFEYFYGSLSGFRIFGLVPSREENPSSSLGYMVYSLMKHANPGEYNFFLHDFPSLYKELLSPNPECKKLLLIGLSGALIAFSEHFRVHIPDLVVMETGGMKGKGKELVREELHAFLRERFGVPVIHSEYGMTELLSQAYSKETGLFSSPPWMKVLIRDAADPFNLLSSGQTGGINIIDLANFNSCSFIETQDLGRLAVDSRFEVLGRFDHSELRGCNLLAF